MKYTADEIMNHLQSFPHTSVEEASNALVACVTMYAGIVARQQAKIKELSGEAVVLRSRVLFLEKYAPKNDPKNQPGSHGDQRSGQATQQAEPLKRGSGSQAQTSGKIQDIREEAPEEIEQSGAW